MNYLDENTYEEIIKKLVSCKEDVEDNWKDLINKKTENINEYWRGADSEAFQTKLNDADEYVDKLVEKIDQTIEYYKQYIKQLELEKMDKENGIKNQDSGIKTNEFRYN